MNIIGHKKIVDYFEKSIQRGNISHAYIFSGPEHVGKFTFAMDLARKLLGDSKEINPDLLVVRPEIEEKNGKIRKKAIAVSDIREMQRKMHASSLSGKYRIAIIDDAQYLNISAQNALLKTLEEPPQKAIIILISNNQEKFLPTVISRCLTKKFNPVSPKEIAGMIPENGEKEGIIFWSLGRPGLAKFFLENPEEIRERRKMLKELEDMMRGNVNDRFLAAEAMSKNSIKMAEKMNWWSIIFREIILGNKIADIPPEKAFRLLEKTQGYLREIRETNSNPRLILENLVLEF